MSADPGASRPTAPEPRARFFGTVPTSYEGLNPWLATEPTPAGPRPADGPSFVDAAATAGLDRAVKVVQLPVTLPGALLDEALLGMERLRDRGALSALRGGRATDLPRPVAAETAEQARVEAPALVDLVAEVEAVLAGGPLFVRALKLDDARASTTAPEPARTATNFHFDAEKSSLADYPDPVFQFYLNAGRLERQFRILPFDRETVLGCVGRTERAELPLEEILRRFLSEGPAPVETIPVASGSLAVFDGRRFAHDAGKADVDALLAGRFEPAAEPDFVIALDTAETGYHEGYYRPELPFFEDRGV